MKYPKSTVATILISITILTSSCDQVDAIKTGTYDFLDQTIEQVKEKTDKAKETIDNLKNSLPQPQEKLEIISPTESPVEESQNDLLKEYDE